MCRIAGIIHPALPLSEIETTVSEMCELLKHGGPDDGGITSFANEHLVLGNRRLSLLDLTEAGHQPMQYNKRFTITYNGELYNFKTLKNELSSEGMQFVNHTDTEVILAAFAKWNTDSFSRLNGMFAFALWDDHEKALYIVRDAAGIKPLYYSTHTGGLTFASEIRAFAPVSYLRQKNEQSSVFQLAYGYIPEPVTTLLNVKPLPKGCYLKYDVLKGSCSLRSFRFFSFTDTITDTVEAKESVRYSLEDSVQRQMIADAPVGVFLSGGVDSAIVAGLANEAKKENLHTLSIYFNENKYSEKKYQDLLADKLKSRHHSFLLKEENFHAHFPEIIKAMDMPSSDGINTWFISKFAAAEGLKAVLSGIGADELFGGYPSFTRTKAALQLQHFPDMVLNIAGKAKLKKLSRISYLKIDGVRGVYLFLRGHYTASQIAAQLGAYEKEVWNILNDMPASPQLYGIGAKNTASWLEFNMYMQDQLLRDADVMGMAHGLEIRVPFLDDKVIDAAFSIKENVKFRKEIPKELLINSCKEFLPEAVWKRPKMGFSLPFAEWLGNSIYVKQLAESKNIQTRKAIRKFKEGKLHWSRIMSLIMITEHAK